MKHEYEYIDKKFILACKDGNLNQVKKLLKSKYLKRNIDKTNLCWVFCDNEDILNYIIFDIRIDFTDDIKEVINDQIDYLNKPRDYFFLIGDYFNDLNKMSNIIKKFQSRDFKNKLESELPQQEVKKKKIKI